MKKILLLFLSHFLWATPVNSQSSDRAYQRMHLHLLHLQNSLSELDSLCSKNPSLSTLQKSYFKIRKDYKSAETILLSIYPQAQKRYNAPPFETIDLADKTWRSTLSPTGLQQIESLIWKNDFPLLQNSLKNQINELKNINQFYLNQAPFELNSAQIFEMISQSLVRIFSQNLGGMDTPYSNNPLQDIQWINSEILDLIQHTPPSPSSAQNIQKLHQILSRFQKAIQTPSEVHFASLIQKYLNPAYRLARTIQLQIQKQNPMSQTSPLVALNTLPTAFFGPDFLNDSYFTYSLPSPQPMATIELGKKLFFDPQFSSSQKMSCATCHSPSQGFSDNQAQSMGRLSLTTRNSPTLWNVKYQKSFFWDGRARALDEQFDHVIFSQNEFNTDYLQILQKLNASPEYTSLFKKAYPSTQQYGLSKSVFTSAIASYLQTLVSWNTPFDRWMRGELKQFPKPAQQGFDLFMGKAGCAACHFPPLFNGTSGPYFSDSEFENIGTLSSFDTLNPKLSLDLGRGEGINHPIVKGFFKTPTLRELKHTAPYMHQGQFKTLREVVVFYNKGGGAGLGLKVPHQTLPSGPLNLNKTEIDNLVAFLESLSTIQN